MSVGVLLITHGRLGHELIAAATQMLGSRPPQLRALPVGSDDDPDALVRISRGILDQIDSGHGVMVLTDLFGSTPYNIAARLSESENCKVVSGVNLPMLVRIINYPDLPLDALLERATAGAREGVMTCAGPGQAARPVVAGAPRAQPSVGVHTEDR
jgi:PTS system mannose-specific IIA component